MMKAGLIIGKKKRKTAQALISVKNTRSGEIHSSRKTRRTRNAKGASSNCIVVNERFCDDLSETKATENTGTGKWLHVPYITQTRNPP